MRSRSRNGAVAGSLLGPCFPPRSSPDDLADPAPQSDCHHAPAASGVELMTAHDLAEVLNCSTRTVRRLRDEGQLPPALKIGAMVRWRRADVERWLEEAEAS